MKCLAAFTRFAGTYPPYTNISLDGDMIVVTVRGEATQDPKTGHPVSGAYAVHRMHISEFKQLIGEAVSELIVAGADASRGTKEILRRSFINSMSLDG